ncbi:hypothetical protein Tco_0347760 [Tanacetum coccineum]
MVDEPVLGGPMAERVTVSDNSSGTRDGNVDSPSTTQVDGKSTLISSTSYAKLFTRESSRKALNFRTLFTWGGNGVDVVVPVESIRAISERFASTTYSFFLRKRVACPVFANYIRNTWGKYGLVKSKLNSSTGLFYLLFSTIDGLNAMFENDVGNVPVWVKLHGVPVTAFSEDGLSAIAMKLGVGLIQGEVQGYGVKTSIYLVYKEV